MSCATVTRSNRVAFRLLLILLFPGVFTDKNGGLVHFILKRPLDTMYIHEEWCDSLAFCQGERVNEASDVEE